MNVLPIWFIYVAAILRLYGGMAYLKATLSGRAKPKAVSWLIWAMIPLITFFIELSAGVGLIAIVTLALGLSPLMVVIAAFKTDRKLFRADLLDIFCITIALLGIGFWAITQDTFTAIVVLIVADFISAIPTLRKTIHNPQSEYPFTYALSAFSMILALLATQEISFAAFAFPAYVLFINTLLVSLIMFSPRKKSRLAKSKKRKR